MNDPDVNDDRPLPAGTHDDVLRWMSLELDGELRTRERILLTDHLTGCPPCASVAAQLRSARRAFTADASARPPVALVDRILARIARAEETPVAVGARGGSLLRMVRASAALAAGMLVLVGSFYVAHGPTRAVAGSTPTLQMTDPALMRVLERWERGRAARPAFFELLLPAATGR